MTGGKAMKAKALRLFGIILTKADLDDGE